MRTRRRPHPAWKTASRKTRPSKTGESEKPQPPSFLQVAGRRYYSPVTGRRINRDPLGEEGGVNLRLFNRNNALTNLDFLGLLGESMGALGELSTLGTSNSIILNEARYRIEKAVGSDRARRLLAGGQASGWSGLLAHVATSHVAIGSYQRCMARMADAILESGMQSVLSTLVMVDQEGRRTCKGSWIQTYYGASFQTSVSLDLTDIVGGIGAYLGVPLPQLPGAGSQIVSIEIHPKAKIQWRCAASERLLVLVRDPRGEPGPPFAVRWITGRRARKVCFCCHR